MYVTLCKRYEVHISYNGNKMNLINDVDKKEVPKNLYEYLIEFYPNVIRKAFEKFQAQLKC